MKTVNDEEYDRLANEVRRALIELHDCQKLGRPCSKEWVEALNAKSKLKAYCQKHNKRYPLDLYSR